MIVLDKTSFSYRRNRPVLSDLTLEIESGTVCGLLGRNGVGKSTLLYLIAGLLHPSSGSVTCNGYNPFKRDINFLNDIFIVPEEFTIPGISLDEYIRINSVFYPKFSREMFDNLMKTFGMPVEPDLGALSMGQKKKVFLSFALACNTSILLLDEPTNGLDISSKRAFRIAISMAMDETKTVIISTHQVYDVEQILDHVIIADNNRILLNTSMATVSERLRFSFSYDRQRAEQALFSMNIPGGFSIVEEVTDPEQETDVNLEALFEMAHQKPEHIRQLFNESENTYYNK